MSIKKTTVKDFKNKIAQKSLKQQIAEDAKNRATDFMQEIDKLKIKFNCDLGCEININSHRPPSYNIFAIPK